MGAGGLGGRGRGVRLRGIGWGVRLRGIGGGMTTQLNMC
jgi:hypothetical protein